MDISSGRVLITLGITGSISRMHSELRVYRVTTNHVKIPRESSNADSGGSTIMWFYASETKILLVNGMPPPPLFKNKRLPFPSPAVHQLIHLALQEFWKSMSSANLKTKYETFSAFYHYILMLSREATIYWIRLLFHLVHYDNFR